ncbi:nucleotidyltransferase-like protein [Paenibacillus septentrionalis]|uniref:Nucleotidyltransferase-like protein n=1 Tax=Paenibacillus septentrionalis TaxID=429342 RepID=A0ABW1V8Z9_9BACL
MEDIKKQILERYEASSEVQGLVLMHNTERFPFHTNAYVYYVLVVSSHERIARKVEHLEIEQERVFIRTVHTSDIENPSIGVSRYHLMDWLISGEIIADQDGVLQKLKEHILQFPEELRNQRKLKEYAGFLETLFHAKRDLTEGNALDAYSQILASIHHWAHIVLIEEGLHPELTVWKQLRKVHPGIYKLYEELIASPETIDQRVELVMLACEFSVMSKMKDCCTYLLQVMREKEDAWSIAELQHHPKLSYIAEDITLVVQKLVQGQLLKEVAAFHNDQVDDVIELRYVVE